MGEKLLINQTVEESRVALVEGGVLQNLEIDTAKLVHAKGNVYKGVVHRVNASLQAAFVDYGADKQGFLPISEIHGRYYPEALRGKKVPIQEILREGQELMVQVVKDEIGNKGASLTTYVSLPGRYLVLMPDSGKTGLSRRLPPEERKRLKQIISGLPVPDDFGLIIRTAGVEREQEELAQDLDYLKRLWQNLEERFAASKGAGLIHQERSLALRFIRDYATSAIDEIIVDEHNTYEEIRDFCTVLMPEMRNRVRYYTDSTPLFSRYQIEDQIDDVFARRIDLPSGGSIVIDQTEALVAIDVNSGRVKTDDIEDTALKTNLEASTEIARQLKLRDLGGLIVVDFIDMRSKENTRTVEQAARDAFAGDKAKVKFSRISEFGLMEISRQRLKSSIMKGSFDGCTHCGGTGKLRSVESSALYVLRRLKEAVLRGTNYMHVSAKMPVEIANYLLNRKRRDLVELERETSITIDVKGIPHCPPTRAFVEILAATGKGRRPRRILLSFDLVRSDVDKRELDDIEEVLIEAAEARGVDMTEDEFDKIYRAIETRMAKETELEIAQRESERQARERHEESLRLHEAEQEAAARAAQPPPTVTTVQVLPPTHVERTGGLLGWLKALFLGKPVERDQVVEIVKALPAPAKEPARASGGDGDGPRRSGSAERRERPARKLSDRAEGRRRSSRDDDDEDSGGRRRAGGGRRDERPRGRAEDKDKAEAQDTGGAGAEDEDGGNARKKRRRRRRKRSDGESALQPQTAATAASGDKAGSDKAGGDKAGGDKAGGDKAASSGGGDKAGGDKGGRGSRGPRGRASDAGDAAAGGDDKAAARPDKPAPKADEPAPKDDRPAPKDDKPAPREDRAAAREDKPAAAEAGPAAAPDKAAAPRPAPPKEPRPAPAAEAPRPAAPPEPEVVLPRPGGVIDLRGGQAPSTRPAAPPAPGRAAGATPTASDRPAAPPAPAPKE